MSRAAMTDDASTDCGSGREIYLDHNASTPVLPEVLDAMLPYLREHFGNPSSAHGFGRRARAAVEAARVRVAGLIGAAPERLVFTSGGTEANNLAIRGALAVAGRRGRSHVVTSVAEHPATAAPCTWLEGQGVAVSRVGLVASGEVDRAALAAAIREDTALVTLIHAHNETGVIVPPADAGALAHAHGAWLHLDAAQSVGKHAVAVAELAVDLLSIAGHKLGAPKGVGALYVGSEVELAPLLLGANHERGLRPGTENVASIVGLGVACALAGERLAARRVRFVAQRERLWRGLAGELAGLQRHGDPARCLANTLYLSFPGVTGAELLARAPELAASTGSACHDGDGHAPAVLLAMGVPAATARGALRLSLGPATTEDEIDLAVRSLIAAHRALTRSR